MHAPRNDISKSGATAAGEKTPPVSDPDFLDDVLRMLPNGVTVQDEHGRILLANDAAAAQIPIDTDGAPGFGTKLLNSALRAFDGKTEISFLESGVHCAMQCRIPAS